MKLREGIRKEAHSLGLKPATAARRSPLSSCSAFSERLMAAVKPDAEMMMVIVAVASLATTAPIEKVTHREGAIYHYEL